MNTNTNPATLTGWISPEEAAAILNRTTEHLAELRAHRTGPSYTRWQGSVRYSETGVQLLAERRDKAFTRAAEKAEAKRAAA